MVVSEPPRTLYGIDAVDWVMSTIRKMRAARSFDAATWTQYWQDSYSDLGGRSKETGSKVCPRKAAYGLWYLGRIPETGRARQDWPVSRIVEELGRNAAYAVLAANLCRGKAERSVKDIWRAVRLKFQQETGEEAARSEQGGVRLVLALFPDHLV